MKNFWTCFQRDDRGAFGREFENSGGNAGESNGRDLGVLHAKEARGTRGKKIDERMVMLQ